MVLEGPAGIGKTSLIRAAVNAAHSRAMRIFAAQAHEDEAELAFGVVRQMLEPATKVGDADREELLEGSASLAAPVLLTPEAADREMADPQALLHGLFWVCSNACDRGPTLFVIDDFHWADSDSVRFASYLANRVEDLPALLLVASRSGEGDAQAVDALLAAARTREIEIPALDPVASSQVLSESFRRSADQEFVRAAHEATGGNPFLLKELAQAASGTGIDPTRESVAHLDELVPRGVARSIGGRMRRLSPEAKALARAISIAGSSGDLTLAREIAGLNPEQAAEAADLLAERNFIVRGDTLQFVHPLIRSAVYDEIGPGERELGHAKAAEILLARNVRPELPARHLLKVAPAGDPDRVTVLLQAGSEAVARGSAETAVKYLRRGLDEPPESSKRGVVLFELGRAEGMIASRDALHHLTEAARLAPDVDRQIMILRETAYSQTANFGLVHEGRATLRRARELAKGRGSEAELQIQAEEMSLTVLDSALPLQPALVELENSTRDFTGKSTGERACLGLLAWCRAATGRPIATVKEPARLALANGHLVEELGSSSLNCGCVGWALAFEMAEDVLEPVLPALLEAAVREGSRHGAGIHAVSATQLALTRGRLADAEARSREGADAVIEVSSVGASMVTAQWIEALLARGELKAPRAELERLGYLGDLPMMFPFNHLLVARGKLRALTGDLEGGLEDILSAGALNEHWGLTNPAFLPWRSAAAEILTRLGRLGEATIKAEEELQLARRAEIPHAIGRALISLAGADERRAVELLAESIEILDSSPARELTARALIDQGAALRRGNRRHGTPPVEQARLHLRRGVDLASRCGATPLVERGQTELRATGARPRRVVLSGPESLTPSERRTAQMATEGLSNKEIAGALFVSLKTVEKHLGNAYSKLNIRSRAQLGSVLEQDGG